MGELVLSRHWQPLSGGEVQCNLCPRRCRLKAGQMGVCMGRENIEGKLYASNFGQVVTLAIDPIEKKPLYHFHPGARILSVGPNGCNLRCQNCQNWQISQHTHPTRFIPPADLVDMAIHAHSVGIAYTYAEPLIWFEYIIEAAPIARKRGLKTVLVSNGYVNEEPYRELLPHIDAINIDVKSMRPEFYTHVCNGSLPDVLRAVRMTAAHRVPLEITYLIITGLNDSDSDFELLADFVAGVNDRIPVHFSRYFPNNEMTAPPTPLERLQRAYDIAARRLKYVYLGNVEIAGTGDTYCPKCHSAVIRRHGFGSELTGIKGRRCKKCQEEIDLWLNDHA
ncbi:MAG: AmmeMemoRadiSam system radical SAM enzyme [candidate division Zixibacteria bacterium]|nr:AmmeMemoRadiSam system radical SAM enzyme [candidate division Zixibacteria bacterium]